MLLKDKVAIITGIGPGAGRATVFAFAEQGARIVIGARNEAYLKAVATEIERSGRAVVPVCTDLGDRAACEHIVEVAIECFGGVDILVQNGHDTGDMSPVQEADTDRWRVAMEVNLFGALHLFKACYPSMKARGGGRVILINSGASNNAPPPYLASYAASKAAMASLARSIAVECGVDGIRANSVHYGPVEGGNFGPWIAELAAQHGRSVEEELALYCEQEFPLRQVPSPEECAGTVVYLASDLARVVTGQSISVNGGQWFGK